MFDVIMIAVFTVAIVGVIFFAFKPVLDTISRDEALRKRTSSGSK